MNITVLNSNAESAQAQVGPQSVWGPGMSIMQNIRQVCGNTGTGFGECFAREMQQSGASPQAVAFTRQIDNTGYVRDFQPVGRVSIAYVNFPFRANENQGVFLVNGTPSPLDVDNQSLLNLKQMQANPVYQRLTRQYGEVNLFPGDRNGTGYLIPSKLNNGGQRFIASYKLNQGCHACEQVGTVQFAFDFSPTGQFSGSRLISVKSEER